MSKQLNDIQHVTLDGLSLAEWEYAWRYCDYLQLGDEEPSGIEFDPTRIAEIQRILKEKWADHLRSIRGSAAR